MKLVISRSLWRKVTVTCVAVVGLMLVYEVGTFDSRGAPRSARLVDPTAPAAGAHLLFTATAYCKGTTTTSGVGVRTGIAASDPSILPVGSVVNITSATAKYNGVYTIMDTGPSVQGRLLDVYIWSCHEALAFGRQPVEVTVLRLGWNPNQSSPSLIDRLFRRREAARRTALLEAASGGPEPPAPGSPERAADATVGFDSASPAVAPSDAPAASSSSVAPAVNQP